MKKFLLCLVVFTLLYPVYARAYSRPSLSITGLVRQPMNFSLEDLKRFQSSTVQLSEIMKDGSYRGTFYFTGVPLKILLETAFIEKEETAFHKKVDLAIRVRGENGKVVALSWGEVFYKNPDRIVIATSAQPIMPHHSCTGCHSPEEYQPRMDQLNRQIQFPKLVINSDTWANRSLDGITSVEVVDVRPKMAAQKLEKLYSTAFSIAGPGIKEKTFKKLSGFPEIRMTVKHMGEGKGFHGIDRFQGTSLKVILDTLDVKPDLSQVFLASAPDGYRTLFSYGEIYLDPAGERMLVAEKINDKTIENGGKFILVPTDDLMSDRDVKALEKIEVISLRPTPKIFVIGMGCADTNLITLEAISYLSKADAFVCPPDLKKRFSRYMGEQPVLLDIYEFAPPRLRKDNSGLSQENLDALMYEKRAKAVGVIKDILNKGKTVAILDYGDPTIWSGWSWVTEYFRDEMIEIIPGLSSFNVSNALIARKVGCNGSIILTTSRGIKENPGLLKPLSEKGETICIFMGLKDLDTLVPKLKTYYKGETPAFLVYKAGYSGSEHHIRTNLDGLKAAADGYHEKFLGLIYLGPCLMQEKEFCH